MNIYNINSSVGSLRSQLLNFIPLQNEKHPVFSVYVRRNQQCSPVRCEDLPHSKQPPVFCTSCNRKNCCSVDDNRTFTLEDVLVIFKNQSVTYLCITAELHPPVFCSGACQNSRSSLRMLISSLFRS